jgi:CHAT domain-containing protein
MSLVLCVSIDCRREDTTKNEEWGNQPRFSVSIDWQAPQDDRCPQISKEAQAVSMAVAHPPCSDAAIEALKNFARRDANAMSDLAGVYYFRAHRDDRPIDLLDAYDAARHAVAATQRPAGAEHNLQLIEKALGLTRNTVSVSQWQQALKQALRAGDAPQVSRLVALHPTSALRFLEDELLPNHVPEARLLATEWTKITGDRYAGDEVNAVAAADSKKLAALERGYAALRDARIKLFPGAVEEEAKIAIEQLRLGGSPAVLYAIGALALADRNREPLESLKRKARAAQYQTAEAWLLSAEGYFLLYENRYLDSLTNYDAAKALYTRIHDPEGAAATETRRIGLLRVLGQTDVAWREALDLYLNRAQLGAIRDRHLVAGETAAMAFTLGHPDAALAYANEALRIVREERRTTPPDQIKAIEFLETNIAIAHRRRASYEVQTGNYSAALEDLAEAKRLSQDKRNEKYRTALEARIAEVEAEALTNVDPRRAVAAFTTAIALSRNAEYSSFLASLLAKKAGAERRARMNKEAETDLVASLRALNDEESQLLHERKPAQADEIGWNAYFSRFQGTYRILIQLLIESGRGAEAFVYADRARAYEPLNLALKLAPSASPELIDAGAMQQVLRPNTFVVEYTSLADRTYAWIIARDATQVVKLTAKEDDLQRWNDAILRAVPTHDLDTLDATMFAAYDKLLTGPLNVIAHMPGGAHPHLVLIPDGAMYGLPFAALRNPITRRYLIEDADVSTAGSAALYALSIRRDTALVLDQSVYLIGNSRNDLPGAEEEVARISSLYGEQKPPSTGASATSRDFLNSAAGSAIVHVAAHAVIDRQTPSRSSLLFADRALDASQLLAELQPGRTRLVVLAACSSAGGLPVGAQGVGPLVRPLIAKGVPAVVGTLWDVNDATAEPLLVSFHQHYREGDDAAVAMQKAQIELLRKSNSGLQSVLAWAPFQVIGYASSPFAAAR